MKNRGSTPILTNLVVVHPRNIHTKFEGNPCSGLREEIKQENTHTEADSSSVNNIPLLSDYQHCNIICYCKEHNGQKYVLKKFIQIVFEQHLFKNHIKKMNI